VKETKLDKRSPPTSTACYSELGIVHPHELRVSSTNQTGQYDHECIKSGVPAKRLEPDEKGVATFNGGSVYPTHRIVVIWVERRTTLVPLGTRPLEVKPVQIEALCLSEQSNIA
jgi:hypothetical protein